MNSRLGSDTGGKVSFSVASISTALSSDRAGFADRDPVFMFQDLNIVRFAAIRHSPEHCIGIVRVYIFVHADDPLTLGLPQRGNPPLHAKFGTQDTLHHDDDQFVQ